MHSLRCLVLTLAVFLAGPACHLFAFAQADDVNAEDINITAPVPSDLEPQDPPSWNVLDINAKSLEVKVKQNPTKELTCPKTDNGRNRQYAAHKYTVNQIQAAFRAGTNLQSKGKQTGDNHYPHNFRNGDRLALGACGNTRTKSEFPIQIDGKTYSGGKVDAVPDRVIYEYKESKKTLEVWFCGIVRHGTGNNFLNCP